ncbi:MAG TPA: hypothetical protein VGO93_18860 [Candidatus Xenobia bacterium]|jgi:hypothetical protein
MSEAARPLVFLLTVAVFDGLLMIAVACLGLLGHAVWGGRAEAARQVLIDALPRSVLLGLANTAGMVLLVILGARVLPGQGHVLAILLFLGWAWLFLAGLPGVLAGLGQRVLGLFEVPATPALSTITGAVVVCGGGLFPWIGQIMLVLAIAATVGAGTLSALRKNF